ncbi:MAG: GGDEF domain-containing protein [Chromatiales bacterium]|jgi:GGDEF domain-containing protein|nr:MAG: GGDEF domain-containing protein [Chromatiales bacterium]
MNTATVPGLPASGPIAPSRRLLRSATLSVELSAAALYAAWAAIALLADAVAAAPLAAGSGLVLVLGCALTAALFYGLNRLPAAEQPARETLVAAQSMMGLLWATLYTWFTGPAMAGSLLAVGMYLSAIALALFAVTVPMLGRLMLAALLASAAIPVLQLTTLVGTGSLPDAAALGALVPCLALAMLLAAVYVPARFLAGVRARLQIRNAELQIGIERIKRLAERDHLTNSYSRQFILEMVSRERSRADRSGETLCICILDIDHFKDMNDRYGHLAGDRVLAAFARRVRGALRTMDTVNGAGLPANFGADDGEPVLVSRHALGRIGGEEFIVLLPDTSLRGALKCAERVRKAIVRRPFDGLHQVSVSIGIAEYRTGETVSSMLGRADEALYGAKNAGRNRVHCATTDGGPNAIIMPDIPAAS